MSDKRGRGRPRKFETPADRVQAYRQRQEGRRLDGYINNSASWRLQRLAQTWNCSLSAAVERLILEADEQYQDILFPEREKE
jgi:hypothetical protein